jgi:hypothetical protein
VAQLLNALNARSETTSRFHRVFTKTWLWGPAIVRGLSLQVAVVDVPFLQVAFGTASLDLLPWGSSSCAGEGHRRRAQHERSLASGTRTDRMIRITSCRPTAIWETGFGRGLALLSRRGIGTIAHAGGPSTGPRSCQKSRSGGEE